MSNCVSNCLSHGHWMPPIGSAGLHPRTLLGVPARCLTCPARNLIRRAAAGAGAAVVASVAPATGALASPAAKRGRHGDIRDIKHVVMLMQENG